MAYLMRKRGTNDPFLHVEVNYGKVPLRHRRPKFGVPGNGILGEHLGIDPEAGYYRTVYAADERGNRIGKPLYREYEERPPWNRRGR